MTASVHVRTARARNDDLIRSGNGARRPAPVVELRQRRPARRLAADRLQELLSHCAPKDKKSFAELYRVPSPRLFAVATRITRRSDWAEEVLQESFVKIWHHAGSYDGTKSAPMT